MLVPPFLTHTFPSSILLHSHTCAYMNAGGKRALTDAGDEIVELLLGEKRVVQVAEVHFQHARYRVNVMVVLLVSQGVVAWETVTKMRVYPRCVMFR